MRTCINSKEATWTSDIWNLWNSRAVPAFAKGESCSSANYFTPRPWVDEYNRGSRYAGFLYTVQPGNRICLTQWIP